MALTRPLPGLSDRYRAPIRAALWQQVPTAIAFALMLDGGTAARVCGCAVAGFWLGVAIIMVRRPAEPTAVDLGLIRWGFFPLLIASGRLAGLWGRW